MNNAGVKCDVNECVHNVESCKCNLPTIEVTHMKTGANAIDTPHFCKSYSKK